MGSTSWNRSHSRVWVRSLALAVGALAAAPVPSAGLAAGNQAAPSTQPGSEDPAARLYSEALGLYRRGDAASALGSIDRALVIAPERAGLHLLRGWVLMRLARPDDAAEAFGRALHLSPGDPEALTGLGIVGLRRGDPAAALAHFTDALERDPRSSDAARGKVRALIQLGRAADAAAELGILQAASPHDDELLQLAAQAAAVLPAPASESRPRPRVDGGTPIHVVARARGDYLEIPAASGFAPMFVKGMNLGVALPGRFPSEFPEAKSVYAEWLEAIGAMNANTVRIYTLLPPAFYDALVDHNRRHEATPLWLIQGAWAELPPGDDFDEPRFKDEFRAEIERVIDAIHGNLDLPPRPGHAAGRYRADVSDHVLALILGREWEPYSVAHHEEMHPGEARYEGRFARLDSGTAMEAWLAWTCDVAVAHDSRSYAQQRPVAFSSWPTLDPLAHPTETSGAEEDALRRARGEATPAPEYPSPVYNEDSSTVDAERVIAGPENVAGLFASYHIYPYYPDFMNLDPAYAEARDADGPNRYLGYLRALKAHHSSQPLLVAELGLPTSRGAVHVHPQGWNHGGHTGAEQGLLVARMMRSVADARGAGGIVFAWIDEWFKRNWLHDEYELPPERNALWRNALDPEQNYGIVGAYAGPERGGHRLDGSAEEWGAIATAALHPLAPPPAAADDCTAAGTPRLVRAGIDADAAYLHLLLEVAGGDCDRDGTPDWGAWSLLAGIDTYDEAAGERRLLPGDPHPLPTGVEFRLRLAGSEWSDLQVVPPYDIGSHYPRGPFVSQPAGSGRFVRMIREVNRERIGRDGTVYPAIHLDQSPLRFLDAAPASGDLADVATAARDTTVVLEVRIAWGLLQFTDPSSRTLLWQTQSHWPPFDTATSARVIVHLSLRDAEGHEIDLHSLPPYTWPTWEEPVWHLARKSSYSILKEAFAALPMPPPAGEPR
jgi:Flp pilus assembly protein TadD